MRDDAAAPDRPIFVVGCPRSGTTLLQLMLHAHPRIAIPPETRHLLDTYRRRAEFGDLSDPANRTRVAAFITSVRKYRDLKVPRERLTAAIVDGPPTIGSALGLVYIEYARRFDKPRWGDKRPLYLHHTGTLLALFPDAQIVHIIRDGRACVASLKRMPWWHAGSVSAAARWIHSMRDGQRARRRLRPDQYHELRYEDLVADPRAALTQLCAFLGEELDEAMLAPQRMAGTAVPKRKEHHARTQQAVTADQVGAWAAELEPWEAALVEHAGRRWLRAYGYPLNDPPATPPVRARVSLVADLVRRELGTWRFRQADRLRTLRYRRPVAAQLTTQQRALRRG